MSRYSLRHLSNDSLASGLESSAADDRLANATLLAHIAEFDRRGLCRPTQYPSMFRYCVGQLRMSRDMAFKRVYVARVARQFPGVFDAIADGRLNLTGVTLLAPHLNKENGGELLAAAVDRSKAEIQEMLARRFPATGSPTVTANTAADGASPAGPSPEDRSSASQPAELLAGAETENTREPQQTAHVPEHVENAGVFAAPAPNSLPELQVRVTPIAPGRYELVAVIDQAAHDQLMASKELLGHAIPSGALIEVLERAIALQHEQLRKRRCGATDRPRTGANGAASTNARQVPTAVQRAVWARDGGQCAYVSTDGHRCEECGRLELDHVVPVAKGGASTVENLRLLCSAHNRHAAEREFGKAHMHGRREEAKRRRAAERFHKQADGERTERRKAEIERQREELGESFREMGFGRAEVERALGCCATRPEAPIEERIAYALSFMPAKVRTESSAAESASCSRRA